MNFIKGPALFFYLTLVEYRSKNPVLSVMEEPTIFTSIYIVSLFYECKCENFIFLNFSFRRHTNLLDYHQQERIKMQSTVSAFDKFCRVSVYKNLLSFSVYFSLARQTSPLLCRGLSCRYPHNKVSMKIFLR